MQLSTTCNSGSQVTEATKRKKKSVFEKNNVNKCPPNLVVPQAEVSMMEKCIGQSSRSALIEENVDDIELGIQQFHMFHVHNEAGSNDVVFGRDIYRNLK